MTQTEADQLAASMILRLVVDECRICQSEWRQEVVEAVGRIEVWLRRRAVAGDKILTRQMERPVGRKVGLTPKQLRNLGHIEGGGK